MSKETAKSSVLTDYVIYGDGQFTFKVTTPEDRDRKLKVLIKNSKEKALRRWTAVRCRHLRKSIRQDFRTWFR